MLVCREWTMSQITQFISAKFLVWKSNLVQSWTNVMAGLVSSELFLVFIKRTPKIFLAGGVLFAQSYITQLPPHFSLVLLVIGRCAHLSVCKNFFSSFSSSFSSFSFSFFSSFCLVTPGHPCHPGDPPPRHPGCCYCCCCCLCCCCCCCCWPASCKWSSGGASP